MVVNSAPSNGAASAKASADHFPAWPLLLAALLFVTCAAADYNDPHALVLAPLFLGTWLLEPIFSYRGIRLIGEGRYKLGGSFLGASAFLILTMGFPVVYGGIEWLVVSNATLSVNEPQYMERILAAKPDSQGHRFIEFDWEDYSIAPECGPTLVYDDSDELALPVNKRSKEWWKMADGMHGAALDRYRSPNQGLRKIRSHFYFFTACPKA